MRRLVGIWFWGGLATHSHMGRRWMMPWAFPSSLTLLTSAENGGLQTLGKWKSYSSPFCLFWLAKICGFGYLSEGECRIAHAGGDIQAGLSNLQKFMIEITSLTLAIYQLLPLSYSSLYCYKRLSSCTVHPCPYSH